MSTQAGSMSTHEGFFAMPSTSLGRASALTFLVGIVLVVLSSTALESVSLAIGDLNVMGALNFLVMLGALVTGAIALIRGGERSWAVWVATVLPAMLVAFTLFELTVGG